MLLERARDAQRDFERVRIRHYERDAWGGGRCDEHIGRFCLTHDGDQHWNPAPEADAVAEARDELIAVLDSVAVAGPTDDWVLGQRVKYLLEAGEPERALALTTTCDPTGWWCDALAGLIHHSNSRALEATAGFDRALARMPIDERCRWESLTGILERDDRRTYERLTCGSDERGRFQRRVWHLAEPLWSREGLTRRNEHLARQVWVGIQSDAASGYGLPWGDDLDEITTRYGWPVGWDVAWRRTPGVRTERSIEAHRHPHAQSFLPRGVQEGPSWDLDDESPRATWAMPSGPIDEATEYQIAAFRRGDLAVLVGALGHTEGGCQPDWTLSVTSDTAVIDVENGEGARRSPAVYAGDVEWVGLERVCRDESAAIRARLPVNEPGKFLSDLLLLDPTSELPGTLDATLPHVRSSARVRPEESVVVYWEWYGPPDPVTVTLTLSRQNKSFWRKALEFVKLADRQIERTGVRWTDAGPGGEQPRAIRMDLPDLAEGEYRLTLEVQSARVGSVSAVKDIVVAN